MFRDLDTGEWTVGLAWYQINNQVLMHQSLAKCISLNQRPKGHTENRSRNPHMHMSIDNKHWQCVSIIHVKTLPGRIVPFIRQYWWPWMCSKVKVTVKKKRHAVELVIDALTIRKFTDNTKFLKFNTLFEIRSQLTCSAS